MTNTQLRSKIMFNLHRFIGGVTLCAFIFSPLSHSLLWAEENVARSSYQSQDSTLDHTRSTSSTGLMNLLSLSKMYEKVPIASLNHLAVINQNNTSDQSQNPGSASLAIGYKTPLNSQVNPRTGVLQLTLSVPDISGFLGSNITPSISYQQSQVNSGKHMLGLPLGWSFPFSYISKGRLFINGEHSYAIDHSCPSGLKYYKLKNVVFKRNTTTPLPFDKRRSYEDTLCFQSGETQYFDIHGRVLGISDRFGNYVLFYYKQDGNIHDSLLDKIINSYGQEITFEYFNDKIIVTYLKDQESSISFAFLTDQGRLHLVQYLDPLGNKVKITNKGGNVEDNLVSKVEYPNGLTVDYEYSTIRYKTPSDFGSLDAVACIKETYQGQTRAITYNYNPRNDNHYFTNYPKDYVTTLGDPLLESNDNKFRYKTQVNDGVFITEHIYNYLHLELEKIIFTQDLKKINHTIYTYSGERDKRKFPSFDKLPTNFQTPTRIVTKVYNDQGEERTYKIEQELNDYGQPVHIKSFSSHASGSDFVLKNETTLTYDNTHYGLLLQNNFTDYTNPAPNSRRIQNVLTDDKKNIQTSTLGFLDGNTFKPIKTASFQYDKLGRMTFEKLEWVDGQQHMPNSSHQSMSYSISGNELAETRTDAQNHTIVVKKNAMMGWVMSVTHPRGTTSFTYDKLGRRITGTDVCNNTIKWFYEDKTSTVTIFHPNGYQSSQTYNGFGDLIQLSDQPVESPHPRILLSKTYNDKGQLESEQGILREKNRLKYVYNPRGELESITDALGNTKRFEYDPVHQWQKDYFNDQFVQQTSFNDLHLPTQESLLDSKNEMTESSVEYNSLGNPLSQTFGKNTAGQVWMTDHFQYDVQNQTTVFELEGFDHIHSTRSITRDLFGNNVQDLITITGQQPNAQSFQSDLFEFNDLNQLTKEQNPLGQAKVYHYDDAGRLTAYTDYAGRDFIYSYYPNGLIHSETYHDDAGRTCSTEYVYDSKDYTLRSIRRSCNGQEAEEMLYSFTSDGKPVSITYPDGRSVRLDYDMQTGQVSQFTDALGKTTQYVYDDHGRISKITRNEQTAFLTYYSKEEDSLQSGNLKTFETGKGLKYIYAYYPNGNLKTLNVANQGVSFLTTNYTYDPTTDNILQTTYSSSVAPMDPNVNCTIEYTYNSLNQLIKETSQGISGKVKNSTYSYDAANNISQILTQNGEHQTSTEYTYDLDNKLIQITTSTGTQGLKYDIHGNLQDDGKGHLFTYNEKNQLIGYQDTIKGIQAAYAYYPNGLRKSKKIQGNEPIVFYYDFARAANIVNEIQGNQSTGYLIMGNRRFVRELNQEQTSADQVYIQDTKSVIALIDTAGQLQPSYGYDAYGIQSNPKTQVPLLTIENNPFQYSSEYTDEESGLIYLRTRYYDPKIERFISRDHAQTINRYNYAENNPVMFTDPMGRGLPFFIVVMMAAASSNPLTLALIYIAAGVALYMALSGRSDAEQNPESRGEGSKPSSQDNRPSYQPTLKSHQAANLFRTSNPGVSSQDIDSLNAIRVAYPELDLETGLQGGKKGRNNKGGKKEKNDSNSNNNEQSRSGLLTRPSGSGRRSIEAMLEQLRDRPFNENGMFRPESHIRRRSTLINDDRGLWRFDFQGNIGNRYARFAIQWGTGSNGTSGGTAAQVHVPLSGYDLETFIEALVRSFATGEIITLEPEEEKTDD